MAGIDILYLLDRLEEVLAAGSRLPFSSRTMIDEQECLDILEEVTKVHTQPGLLQRLATLVGWS